MHPIQLIQLCAYSMCHRAALVQRAEQWYEERQEQ